ncbi:MAG: phosphatidylserine/phosphatidylglycerophosphate/cardiolipin synthase family protein [Oligoflexia bacterium]|nr:phosphatidylserine/phosphatidylglycerophosphate/cardiolipin synthase family protein [Oligoflexia bacterium]
MQILLPLLLVLVLQTTTVSNSVAEVQDDLGLLQTVEKIKKTVHEDVLSCSLEAQTIENTALLSDLGVAIDGGKKQEITHTLASVENRNKIISVLRNVNRKLSSLAGMAEIKRLPPKEREAIATFLSDYFKRSREFITWMKSSANGKLATSEEVLKRQREFLSLIPIELKCNEGREKQLASPERALSAVLQRSWQLADILEVEAGASTSAEGKNLGIKQKLVDGFLNFVRKITPDFVATPVKHAYAIEQMKKGDAVTLYEHLDPNPNINTAFDAVKDFNYDVIKADPTGLFAPAPQDGGLSATIEKVLSAEETGIKEKKDLRTTHFRTKGNALKAYIDQDFFTKGLIPAIQSAEKSVMIAVSLLGNDTVGKAIIDAIERRLKDRPQLVVNIIADADTSALYWSSAARANLDRLRVSDEENDPFTEMARGYWRELKDALFSDNNNSVGEGEENADQKLLVPGPTNRGISSLTKLWGTSLMNRVLDTRGNLNPNVQILWNHPLSNGTEHRKVAIIDSKQAFLGGTAFGDGYFFNTKEEKQYKDAIKQGKDYPCHKDCKLLPASHGYPRWHDLQVEIKGPAVQQLTANLLLSTIFQGGSIAPPAVSGKADEEGEMTKEVRNQRIKDFWFPQLKLATVGGGEQEQEGPSVRVGQTIPLVRNEFSAGGRALIDRAKSGESLHMHFAYFTCSEFHDSVIKAIKRGVNVNVLLPGGFDNPVAHYAYRNGLSGMMAAGHGEHIKVYEFKKDLDKNQSGYNHDKWVVLQTNEGKKYTMVATGNPEPFSKYQGFDACFTTDDSKFADELLAMHASDMRDAKLVTVDDLKAMSEEEQSKSVTFGAVMRLGDVVMKRLRDKDGIY